MKPAKEPTFTRIVLEGLIRANDFRTSPHLQLELGLSANRVGAALHHLRKHGVVDCMESMRILWWYATPADDDRSRRVDERTLETEPRKPRKPRARKEKPV